jgi:hypothetical protein
VLEPGAWAGCVFSVLPDKIAKSVTQEKWEKAQGIIQALCDVVFRDGLAAQLIHKELERQRGFLVHLSMTFPVLVPFLKGIHLTLDSWREGRDSEGWKNTPKAQRAADKFKKELGECMLDDEQAEDEYEFGMEFDSPLDYSTKYADAPKFVHPVPRLESDLRALRAITSQEAPPQVTLRSKSIYQVNYGFGDASGKGFGSTFGVKEGISYRIGVWRKDQEDKSSNWREFTNVVESLEEEAATGRLTSSMVFFFTDNSTVERALYPEEPRAVKNYWSSSFACVYWNPGST